MRKLAGIPIVLILSSCTGAPPKPQTPSLNPELASSLLSFNNKAKNWIQFVKKQDPACDYKINLPDQSSHPTEIALEHIVSCNGAPAPRQYDASVAFTYDPASLKWTISRFSD